MQIVLSKKLKNLTNYLLFYQKQDFLLLDIFLSFSYTNFYQLFKNIALILSIFNSVKYNND